MKKYIYTILALAMLVFNSCSNSDDLVIDEKTNVTTIKLSLDGKVDSRIAEIKYFVEVYSDDDLTMPANVFKDVESGTSTYKMSNMSGDFSMILNSSTNYHFLFFASKRDYDQENPIYDTSNLQAVTLNPDEDPVEAWSGVYNSDGREDNIDITLSHAVASLCLYENGVIPINSTLTYSFKQPTKFNVATGKPLPITEGTPLREEIINLSSGVNGTLIPFLLNQNNIYIFSTNDETGDLLNITFQMTNSTEGAPEEDPFIASNVIIKANYITNIYNHFTTLSENKIVIDCSDYWENLNYNFTHL